MFLYNIQLYINLYMNEWQFEVSVEIDQNEC